MKIKAGLCLVVALGILLVLSALSCSGMKDSPLIPTNHDQSGNLFPVIISGENHAGMPVSIWGALGFFNLNIDPDNLTAELTSLRGLGSTDVVEFVDITNFLQVAPCTDCVKIKSVTLNSDDNVVLSIGIKHPFGAGDPFKPVTGRNRADLHVFNIEGTIISNASGTTFPGLGQITAGFKLVNASGYSTYLSSIIDHVYTTDATIFPYMLHFDDYSSGNFDPSSETGFTDVTTPGPSGNLVMPMGSDYDFKDYVFDLSSGSIDLIFAVGCTYPLTTEGKATRFIPEYRVPQHNKKAASEVWIEITSGSLIAGDITSTVTLAVNVVDINHGVQVGEGLDEMFADSSVSAIAIEVPGIHTSIDIVDISSPTGTGHSHSDPLIYTHTITNTIGAPAGMYPAIVKIVDNYPLGINTPPLLDGISRVDPGHNPIEGAFSLEEFATYSMFYLYVEENLNIDPVADLAPAGQIISPGDSILWDASGSSDSDGTIVTYEFDFLLEGGDIANFTVDSTTTTPTASADSGSAYDSQTDGTYYAAVRVTDDDDATDTVIVSFEVSSFIPHYWNQYMSNKFNNGQTNVIGPQTNNVEWSRPINPGWAASLVEGFDGTIYVGCGTNAGYIEAINPDNTLKWEHTPSSIVVYGKPLGVSTDDTVVYMSTTTSWDGYIAGIDTETGLELWTYDYWLPSSNYATILDDGDLLIAGGHDLSSNESTRRIDQFGTEVWVRPLNFTWCTTPVQGVDGTVFSRTDANIVALDPDTGAIIDSGFVGGMFNNAQTGLAIRSNGDIVYGGNSVSTGFLVCFDPDLDLQWTLDLSPTAIPTDGIGIGLNDEIYVHASNTVYSVAEDGTHYDWTHTPVAVWTWPVIDGEGTIYMGTPSGAVAMNPDGSVKWSVSLGSDCDVILAHDGSLYALGNGVLHKIKDI